MGIFFDDPKPKVTEREWQKEVRSALFSRGLKEKEINHVESLLHGSMHEGRKEDAGLQKEEIASLVTALKESSKNHTLTPDQITIVEQELHKKL